MTVRYFGLQAVSIPAEDERYPTEEECLARCDQLTAAVDAAAEAKALAGELLGSWDEVRYYPSVSVGGDYWSPRLAGR